MPTVSAVPEEAGSWYEACDALLAGCTSALAPLPLQFRQTLNAMLRADANKRGRIEDGMVLGSDFYVKDGNGCTSLYLASEAGHNACVQQLLSVNACLNETDDDGWSSMMVACNYGHTACVQLLLGAGAAIDQADHYGMTPLSVASLRGHAECLRQLLCAGAAVDQRDDGGCTPLYWASKAGHATCVQLLLAASAAVDQINSDGWSPLAIACNKGRSECVHVLSSFAATRTFAALGTTAEEVSSEAGHDALTQWLVLSRGWTSLHHVEVITTERVRALLRGGADLHAKAAQGDQRTPLARAVQIEQPTAVTQTLQRAAQPWSMHNHDLFPDAVRARAVELLRVGYLLVQGVTSLAMMPRAWTDVWVSHVMRHALCRTT